MQNLLWELLKKNLQKIRIRLPSKKRKRKIRKLKYKKDQVMI